MKQYIKPESKVVSFEPSVILRSSGGGTGCSCGCYSRDYPQSNLGCCGCPSCGHDNSNNHACDDDNFWSHKY